MPLASALGVQEALWVASIVLLVTALKAEPPINKVPLVTAFTTKASTVPSTSASLPCALRAARSIVTAVSSLVVATVEVILVSVGASFTAVTLTCAWIALADSVPELSLATTVKALSVPLASALGVQEALWVASIVLLVTALKAEPPINKVPLVTAFTTKASTVPSTSASLPCALRAARSIVTAVSSLVVATVEVILVSVGASFTAVISMVLVPILEA